MASSNVVAVGGSLAPCGPRGDVASPLLGVWLTPAFEKGKHGQDAAVVLRGCRQAKLLEDAGHVLLDGPGCDEHPLADCLVRATLGHQLEHLALARRELSERVVSPPPAHELRHDGGVER